MDFEQNSRQMDPVSGGAYCAGFESRSNRSPSNCKPAGVAENSEKAESYHWKIIKETFPISAKELDDHNLTAATSFFKAFINGSKTIWLS